VGTKCWNQSTSGSSGGSTSNGGGLLGRLFSGSRQSRPSPGFAANEKGVAAYNRGDWASAVAIFQEALAKEPNDPTIQQNLANARQALGNAQAAQAREQQQRDLVARREQQEEQDRKQREKAAADNMQQAVRSFTQTLGRVPSSGDLDFDSGKPAPSVAASTSPKAPPSTLEFGDPRVVDTRALPPGLPKAVDDAVVGAYRNAPPGVSDRVRKGFQAVENRDWKVAKAWFEDALNRDPSNPGLKRLVQLADAAPARTGQPAATGDPLPAPSDELTFLFPDPDQEAMREALDNLFGLPRSQ
jgi:tetratricopeptide (TPR) repeat protein